MHNEEKEATSEARSEGERGGVKEAALASFVRTYAPRWLPPRRLDFLIDALEDHTSVARLVFNLGRRYELVDQARRLIAARATIHGVSASSVIVDELAGEVAEGVSRG